MRVQPVTISPSTAAITQPSWNQSTDWQAGQRTWPTDGIVNTLAIVPHDTEPQRSAPDRTIP